ncbi:hypothetical protein [Acinetobacter pittii]|uniref:DUF4145 domain-containing protein n=1 Tax=Acinetobacter pittii TaxID=48296 RepID=A0A3R9QH11_ACIPI|nr:hypothetical protein [Acinetobacter pittii]HEM6651526.1 hypothetical protein [Acinetobacter baumannii]KQE17088.1 hypothetical protein APD36_16590 [Acinetobacter pittii]KRI47672.1 hypothetical protein APC42_09960 [Acinetobacter pittii]RSO51606.1 hypothetical protein EA758_15000 [Acinetobacter pittii]RSO57875.1 hypothetical protein EA752_14755 [Acinetobacter pittii]
MSTEDQKLKNFLEKNALYETIELTCVGVSQQVYDVKEIYQYCEECEMDKPFHTNGCIAFFQQHHTSSYSHVTYECVSCRKKTKQFWTIGERSYHATDKENKITVRKVGEWPRSNLSNDKVLEKFFKKDRENYFKAEVCLSHGYGIAAFAYMRRIVEENIVSLLDMIAQDENAEESMLDAIAQLKTTSPMSDKITIAKKALPSYLSPNGLNPLGQIYKQLSEGVHSLSDEECLKRANTIKFCLRFLISELANHRKTIEEFKSSISLLGNL